MNHDLPIQVLRMLSEDYVGDLIKVTGREDIDCVRERHRTVPSMLIFILQPLSRPKW